MRIQIAPLMGTTLLILGALAGGQNALAQTDPGPRRLQTRATGTVTLLDGIGEMLALKSSDTVLDAGCGEGFYLGSLAQRHGFQGHGLDISIPAIEAAAKRYPHCEWVVGNADRFLPYEDTSFTHVLSITGRRNAAEFRADGRHAPRGVAVQTHHQRGAGDERDERAGHDARELRGPPANHDKRTGGERARGGVDAVEVLREEDDFLHELRRHFADRKSVV